MWLALWCPIRSICWLWLTSTVFEARLRSCATARPWKSWSSRSSLELHWQVRRAQRTGQGLSCELERNSLRFLTILQPFIIFPVCANVNFFFCNSPAWAFWDSSQDPSEPRPLDSWDRISDWRLQAQTQGAENTLPGWHWENVWWEIRAWTSTSLFILKAQTNTPSDLSPLPSIFYSINELVTVTSICGIS